MIGPAFCHARRLHAASRSDHPARWKRTRSRHFQAAQKGETPRVGKPVGVSGASPICTWRARNGILPVCPAVRYDAWPFDLSRNPRSVARGRRLHRDARASLWRRRRRRRKGLSHLEQVHSRCRSTRPPLGRSGCAAFEDQFGPLVICTVSQTTGAGLRCATSSRSRTSL